MHARFNSFVHLLVFVRKTTRKVTIKVEGFETKHKHLAVKDQIQNARVQSLN